MTTAMHAELIIHLSPKGSAIFQRRGPGHEPEILTSFRFERRLDLARLSQMAESLRMSKQIKMIHLTGDVGLGRMLFGHFTGATAKLVARANIYQNSQLHEPQRLFLQLEDPARQENRGRKTNVKLIRS